MPQQLNLTVDAPSSDRLDRWLTGQLEDFSRSRIQALLKEGCVSLNGAVCDRKSKFNVGDQVCITLPEAETFVPAPEDIPITVLYEDESLIIIDKPAGMVVHPSPAHPAGTVVNALLHHCQGQLAAMGGVERPGIVQRLDRETTGTLVVAKTDEAFDHLQKQLDEKTAKREYLGVVYGSPREVSGRIDRALGKDPKNRKKQAIVPINQGGRRAVTHWTLQERIGDYALLLFQLETGRTHQIRAHCEAMQHPIVGDGLYSVGRSVGVKLEGQALHAWRLTLEHPVTGEELVVVAPPPEGFVALVNVLRQRAKQ